MIKDPQITLFDLMICLSEAIDLMSPILNDHHNQVAYIASALGSEIGLDNQSQANLILAAAIHDVGALSRLQTADQTLQSRRTRAAKRHHFENVLRHCLVAGAAR